MTTVTHVTPAQLVNLCHRLGTEQVPYATVRTILKTITFDPAALRMPPLTGNGRMSSELDRKLAAPIESRASGGKFLPVHIPRDLSADAPVVTVPELPPSITLAPVVGPARLHKTIRPEYEPPLADTSEITGPDLADILVGDLADFDLDTLVDNLRELVLN